MKKLSRKQLNNHPIKYPTYHPVHPPTHHNMLHQELTRRLLNQHHKIQGQGQREGHVLQDENNPVEGQGKGQMKGHGLIGVRHGVGHGIGGHGQGIKAGQNLGRKAGQNLGRKRQNPAKQVREVAQNLEQTGKADINPEVNIKNHINS